MENLTDEIKRIIDWPLEKIDVSEAATLLLRVNRNQILFNNIIRRNDKERVLYELKKIYDFRMQDEALKKTAEMEVEAKKVIEQNPEFTLTDEQLEDAPKGMRTDHEELPDEIKALFTENFNIFRRMRKLHEQLKLMNNQKPCDRYPFLKELLELDKQHRDNYNTYDAYKIGGAEPAQQEQPEQPAEISTVTVADPKLVSAARKYLSTNKAKVATLEGEAKEALLQKMQERYSYLVATDSGISEEQKEEYKALGLNV